MNSILDNELVRKYFDCAGFTDCTQHDCKEVVAYKILQSMQQPIKKGEGYLLQLESGEFIARFCGEETRAYFHPYALRLPDRFQKPRKCHCGTSEIIHRIEGPCYHINNDKPSPEKCCFLQNYPGREHDRDCPAMPKDEVEEKMDSIVMNWSQQDNLIQELRALVKLARRAK